MKFLYFAVIGFAIIIPFFSSFGPKIQFYKKWKYLLPSMLLTMLVFIPWDILKTHHGVWGFNSNYISGLYLINLPLEEWLFFISVPYACIFTYEVVILLVKKDIFHKFHKGISIFLIFFLLLVAMLFHDRIYTMVTFIALAFMLVIHQFVIRSKYLSYFYLTYLICLLPFLLVNGILTGSFIPEEIVWYNDSENLGIRLFTIPVEDVFYGMLLILINLTFYNFLKNRKKNSESQQVTEQHIV